MHSLPWSRRGLFVCMGAITACASAAQPVADADATSSNGEGADEPPRGPAERAPEPEGLVASLKSRCHPTAEPAADRARPTRDDAIAFADSIKEAVVACGQEHVPRAGILFLNYTVAGESGGVTEISVAPDHQPLLECIARALLSACYAPFNDSVFKVKFPFRL